MVFEVDQLGDALSRALPGTPVHFGNDPDLSFGPWHASPSAARSAARVECSTEADVATALRIAADAGAGVAVAGGRYDAFARNARVGDLVVDLRRMNRVSYDASAATVTVGGGVTSEMLHAALPGDRVVPVSNTSKVGLAALATGGGYGWLNSGFGLTTDSLLSARVVVADGTIADASPSGDAELLWALRGGGTGFGAITSMTLAVHELASLLHCVFVFGLENARQALLRGQELIDENPDRLSMATVLATGPDGQPALFMLVDALGEPDEAGALADAFAQLPGAVTAARASVPFRDTLGDDAELFPAGLSWSFDHLLLPRIEESTIASLLDAARAMPSPRSFICSHDFHGKPTRVDPGATAFPLRREHFVTHVDSGWQPGDDAAAERARAWTRDVIDLLSPEALPGGYINFLSPEQTDRVRAFYGPAADRLTRVRDRVDPNGVFSAATGLF
jgi:FAD/FMN-containing dehydrogenase